MEWRKYEEDFNFELRPAWVISSQTKVNPELPEEEQNYVTKDYVDAITGEMKIRDVLPLPGAISDF